MPHQRRIVELPVSKVIPDKPVKNTDALANSQALALSRDLPALKTRQAVETLLGQRSASVRGARSPIHLRSFAGARLNPGFRR